MVMTSPMFEVIGVERDWMELGEDQAVRAVSKASRPRSIAGGGGACRGGSSPCSVPGDQDALDGAIVRIPDSHGAGACRVHAGVTVFLPETDDSLNRAQSVDGVDRGQLGDGRTLPAARSQF